MKIFKWYHVLFICCAVTVVTAILLVLSFNVKTEEVPRWSLFSALFFGLGSFSLSLLALWISIQTFVKTNKQEREKIQNEAKQFIIDHNDEIDYLPLCLIADCYDRHRKYKRNIYVSFNRLNTELQNEVLKQQNYQLDSIKSKKWLKESKTKIESFIAEYHMGKDFLFDYYEHSLIYSEKPFNSKLENANIISSQYLGLPSYRFQNGNCYDTGITFKEYATLYLNAEINNDKRLSIIPKPLDELIKNVQIDDSNQENVCFWSICVIDAFADILMKKPKTSNKKEQFPKTHAKIETFEDRFLLSLSVLYNLSNYLESKK